MHMVRLGISGLENKEIVWARSWPRAAKVATVVNEDELTDTLVVRYRLSFLDRLKVLFGQDLFIWFSTYGRPPQWPQPYLSNPFYGKINFGRLGTLAKTLPMQPAKWFKNSGESMARGYEVENPQSGYNRLAESLEEQLNRSVPEMKTW